MSVLVFLIKYYSVVSMASLCLTRPICHHHQPLLV